MAVCASESILHFLSSFSEDRSRDDAVLIESFGHTHFSRVRQFYGITEERIRGEFAPPFTSLPSYKTSGRSNAVFHESHSGLLLVKSIKSPEAKCLQSILLSYVDHVTNPTAPSLIMPIFGLFTLDHSTHYILFLSTFFRPDARPMVGVFDLKGRESKRPPETGPHKFGSPYLDKDLPNVRTSWPLLPHLQSRFLATLLRDAAFLRDCNILDYSLLVGVVADGPHWQQTAPLRQRPPALPLDPFAPGSELWFREAGGGLDTGLGEVWHVGIVDCLTPWTAAKRTANTFKRLRWRQSTLSTVKPPMYCERFCRFHCSLFVPSVVPAERLFLFYRAAESEKVKKRREKRGRPLTLPEGGWRI